MRNRPELSLTSDGEPGLLRLHGVRAEPQHLPHPVTLLLVWGCIGRRHSDLASNVDTLPSLCCCSQILNLRALHAGAYSHGISCQAWLHPARECGAACHAGLHRVPARRSAVICDPAALRSDRDQRTTLSKSTTSQLPHLPILSSIERGALLRCHSHCTQQSHWAFGVHPCHLRHLSTKAVHLSLITRSLR
jgi:hypothetical protein